MYNPTSSARLLLSLHLLCTALFNVSFAASASSSENPCEQLACGFEIHHDDGTSFTSPAMATAVEINVNGSAVHTQVSQSFNNTSEQWVEGVYSYPLPTGAVVNQLRMQIGERVIVGEIKERKAAEKAYAKAKASGRKASLVKAHRPNVFTTKLANLGPNETVEISIEYFTELALSTGKQALRFPMVVGPRYQPASQSRELDGPPLPYLPSLRDEDISHNPLSLRINLNIGVALESIHSLYHPINTRKIGNTDYRIQLAEGSVAPKRDFVLEFAPAQKGTLQTALLSERKNGFHYGLFMIMPPKANVSTRLPREITFILDRSGSMGGTSMEQAKAALIHALGKLTTQDRFNIIWFNSQSEALFSGIVPAAIGNLNRAKALVTQLQASGGTEMMGALKTAFSTEGSSKHVQQIVFITDGNVSNEQSLFSFIEDNLGSRRLFTIGIGSAPNQYFLQHAASAGRGIHTFIGDTREVGERMNALLSKLEQPMLRDIEIIAESNTLEFWPQALPDLYADEPIAIAFRTKSSSAELLLTGKLPNRHWQASSSLGGGQYRRGLAELWAKRKISFLMEEYRRNIHAPEKRELNRTDIVETALTHHVVSKFTSLVAVEKTPSNPALKANQTQRVARHMPHGWTLGGSNSRLPQTGTGAQVRILFGLILLLSLLGHYVHRRNAANEKPGLENA